MTNKFNMSLLFHSLFFFNIGCSVGDTYPKHFDNPQIPQMLKIIEEQSNVVAQKSLEMESYFDEYRRLSVEEQESIGKAELQQRFEILQIEQHKLDIHMNDFRDLLKIDKQTP